MRACPPNPPAHALQISDLGPAKFGYAFTAGWNPDALSSLGWLWRATEALQFFALVAYAIRGDVYGRLAEMGFGPVALVVKPFVVSACTSTGGSGQPRLGCGLVIGWQLACLQVGQCRGCDARRQHGQG